MGYLKILKSGCVKDFRHKHLIYENIGMDYHPQAEHSSLFRSYRLQAEAERESIIRNTFFSD
jgi:hypothetical protein